MDKPDGFVFSHLRLPKVRPAQADHRHLHAGLAQIAVQHLSAHCPGIRHARNSSGRIFEEGSVSEFSSRLASAACAEPPNVTTESPPLSPRKENRASSLVVSPPHCIPMRRA